jgi:hypothetical protein
LGEAKSRVPKSSVIKILISKFFENRILRSSLWRNPHWARIFSRSREKMIRNPAWSADLSRFTCHNGENYFW